MVFVIRMHVNGHEQAVTAERRGRAVVVETERGTSMTRNVNSATRNAADVLGPPLERAQRSSSAWGLYVAVGKASALFGTWPPEGSNPQVSGPQPKPSAPVSRIYDHWARRDGTPLGALDAVLKIIDAYAEHGHAVAA